MENILKGTSILIGRDSSNSKLLISVAKEGQPAKGAFVGEEKVPGSVSRCKPKEKVAHCKIDIDVSGRMYISNLKDTNRTFVDDIQIDTKKITPESKISLGCEHYNLDLNAVLSAAAKVLRIVEKDTPLSIAHLEPIWNEYQETLDNIKKEQQKRKKVCSFSRILSPLAIVLSIFLTSNGYGDWAKWAYLLTGISILITIYVEFLWKDSSDDNKKDAYAKLVDRYICPNPDCRHVMGPKDYQILKQDKKCPYCQHAITADK